MEQFTQTSVISNINNCESLQNWTDLLEREVNNHCHHSLTNPTILLVFINNPLLHGKYIPPIPHELAWLNLGVYALEGGKQANKVFLATEYRFCEILSLLSKISSQASQDLQEQLYQELNCMSCEKEIHWAQQWVNFDQGQIIVNTGKPLCSYVTVMITQHYSEIHYY